MTNRVRTWRKIFIHHGLSAEGKYLRPWKPALDGLRVIDLYGRLSYRPCWGTHSRPLRQLQTRTTVPPTSALGLIPSVCVARSSGCHGTHAWMQQPEHWQELKTVCPGKKIVAKRLLYVQLYYVQHPALTPQPSWHNERRATHQVANGLDISITSMMNDH